MGNRFETQLTREQRASLSSAGAKISARILHSGCRAARVIPEDAFIHQSALDKIAQDPNYRPVNIPKKHQTIPMQTAPVEPAQDADDEDDA